MKWDLSTVVTIVQLAQQYGPFLFSILFIFFVTRTAHKYYRECNTREDPPASEDEKRTYRSYFKVSVWAGLALMLLSVVWWFYSQIRGTNVYQIAIVGLKPNESVLSNYYVKDVPRPTMPGVPPLHDYFFVVVQSEPFKVGDKFAFYYFNIPAPAAAPAVASSPAGIPGQDLEIEYSGNKLDTFHVFVDGGSPSLKLVAGNSAVRGTSLALGGVEPSGEKIALRAGGEQ
jgi:hypothetical protein